MMLRNFQRLNDIYISSDLSFLIFNFFLEILKFPWQCSQYLKLNPTCALNLWIVVTDVRGSHSVKTTIKLLQFWAGGQCPFSKGKLIGKNPFYEIWSFWHFEQLKNWCFNISMYHFNINFFPKISILPTFRKHLMKRKWNLIRKSWHCSIILGLLP